MNTYPVSIFIHRNHSRGYIALVSAIILSAILTAISITESTAVFWARFSQIDEVHHTQSLALSNSCAYEALVAYASNPDLLDSSNSTTPKTLTIQPGITCLLLRAIRASPNSASATLYVETNISGAQVLEAVSATQTTGTAGNPDFGTYISSTSWSEVTSIPP